MLLREGKLYRRLSKAGRISLVQMGDDTISSALAELYVAWRDSLPADISSIERMHPEFGGLSTSSLVKVLGHFDILA